MNMILMSWIQILIVRMVLVVMGPKFSRYRAEDMTKDFKFKLGMEFSSLKDFKQALMEHSVLNGKEVQFVKNDQKRVRAVCKKNVVS